MKIIFYERRISHNPNTRHGDFARWGKSERVFTGSMVPRYHAFDAGGVFLGSFLKPAALKKVLGPAKFFRLKPRRETVED